MQKLLWMETRKRERGTNKMSRCKIAEGLWGKVKKEGNLSVYTGYDDDLAIAYDEYISHIQDHGCWRYEP